MTVPAEELRLAADFDQPTREQWRRLALAVLRKSGVATQDTPADEVERLLSTTYDGISIAPLYTADDPATSRRGLPGLAPYVRGRRAAGGVVSGWDVRARHAAGDAKATREAVIADLENGATSIWLVLGPGGIAIDALPEVLDGVYLDLAGVVLDAGDRFAAAADAWFALLAARGVDPAAGGSLGADPLIWRARTGDAASLAGNLDAAARLAGRCLAETPGLRTFTVDATAFHDAGGDNVDELGCALAAGVGYLRALTDHGLSAAEALGQLEFRFAATADQFATIAKFRAARRLWARVAQVCDVPDAGGQRQHAVTSAAMMTARDPWVNLLRGTIACFGAGVGGADSVTVLPFDHRLGQPDGFARRLARNTQALLMEESHVARVIDPAGGSWYVERLTDDLARAAWAWFTEIERAGGLGAALDSGLVADRLAASWQRRADRLAHRTDPITGVSEFPQLDERLPQRIPAPPLPGGGLPRHHLAEGFEGLRDRADRFTQAHGARPTIFLAMLGSLAASSARLAFVTNLLAAGGIATVTAGGADPGAIAAAFTGSGATVACLCGPDKAYASDAAAVATALLAAGARRVWLAGRGEYEGIGGQLFAGCDALAVLTTALTDLEAAA